VIDIAERSLATVPAPPKEGFERFTPSTLGYEHLTRATRFHLRRNLS
jgi:hypothetical protein